MAGNKGGKKQHHCSVPARNEVRDPWRAIATQPAGSAAYRRSQSQPSKKR